VALLLYGYSRGVYSSRQLARACEERVDMMVVTGLNRPDFRTISDFRKRHLAALSDLFVQVLRLCRAAGLVKLGHVAVDGTKLRANASRHKAMSYQHMLQREPKLAAEVTSWLDQAQGHVTPRPGGQLARIGAPGRVGVVAGRGDRQHAADRLDPIAGAVIIDESDHGLDRRSSSAIAKYADALRRISLACRSSRFSRSSARIRSRSSPVGPARTPWSRSACRTQPRSVSAVQPILAAIELIAAHCEA
jgi:hypothetical protein